jgi:hypothetical protein
MIGLSGHYWALWHPKVSDAILERLASWGAVHERHAVARP